MPNEDKSELVITGKQFNTIMQNTSRSSILIFIAQHLNQLQNDPNLTIYTERHLTSVSKALFIRNLPDSQLEDSALLSFVFNSNAYDPQSDAMRKLTNLVRIALGSDVPVFDGSLKRFQNCSIIPNTYLENTANANELLTALGSLLDEMQPYYVNNCIIIGENGEVFTDIMDIKDTIMKQAWKDRSTRHIAALNLKVHMVSGTVNGVVSLPLMDVVKDFQKKISEKSTPECSTYTHCKPKI